MTTNFDSLPPHFVRQGVAYHQFVIMGATLVGDVTPNSLISNAPPLAPGEPDHVSIITGTHTGMVNVGIVQLNRRPLESVPGYDAIAEASIGRHAGGDIYVSDPELGRNNELGVINADASYLRLRVSAAGRSDNFDGGGIADRERYLLVTWPEPPSRSMVLVTDAVNDELLRSWRPHGALSAPRRAPARVTAVRRPPDC